MLQILYIKTTVLHLVLKIFCTLFFPSLTACISYDV